MKVEVGFFSGNVIQFECEDFKTTWDRVDGIYSAYEIVGLGHTLSMSPTRIEYWRVIK